MLGVTRLLKGPDRDMKGHLIHLFEYTRWAHGLTLDSLKRANTGDPRCLQLLSHTAATEEIWLARMRGQAPTQPFWPERSLPEIESSLIANNQNWIRFIREKGEENLKAPIDYANSKGERFSNSIKEIATHVVNHGTHHRAQIASRLREIGIEPEQCDYLFYIRQHPRAS